MKKHAHNTGSYHLQVQLFLRASQDLHEVLKKGGITLTPEELQAVRTCASEWLNQVPSQQ